MWYKASKQSDIDCDLSRSQNVKSDGGIGLQMYDFLLIFSSNIWATLAHLWHTSFQNLSDIDKVKCNDNSGLYNFLLMFKVTYGLNLLT